MKMSKVETFESILMTFDPQDDDFLLRVDDLVEEFSEDFEPLIPSIFKFFERNPMDDCGAPGTLVHLIEEFYPNYVPALLESLRRRPSYHTILMLNRILNSEISSEQRTEFTGILNHIKNNEFVESELREEAADFLYYQNN